MKNYRQVIQQASGVPVSGAAVTIYQAGSTNLATLYSENDVGSEELDNPAVTGEDGAVSFYVADGSYDIKITQGTAETWLRDVEIFDFDNLQAVLGLNFLDRLSAHGAIADAQMVDDGAMEAGQATLTCASGPFTAGDVGKTIIVAGAGAAASKLKTTVSAYLDPTQLTLADPAAATVSAAGVAWGTDCSPALLAGLTALDTARGGTLVIDGYFLLAEPVFKEFESLDVSTNGSILGSGTNSAIIVGVDADEDAITLTGGASIDWSDITFAGIPLAGVDASRVLVLDGVGSNFKRCQFLGLLTNYQCISSNNSGLSLEGCAFGGSFPISLGGTGGTVLSSVVYVNNWSTFKDEGSIFLDYAYWRGLVLSKSGEGNLSAWIGIHTANDTYLTSGARNAGLATLRGTRMDEGSWRGVWFEPGSASGASLELVGTRHNVNAVAGSSGVYAKGADSVLVDRGAFGLSSDPGTAFGRFDTCGLVTIDSVKLRQGVDKIVATNVAALKVRRTEIANYQLVGTNFYPEKSDSNAFAIVKTGAVSDADFGAVPAAGVMGLDRENGRIYIRGAGDWGFIQLDGGTFHAELVTNGTGGSTAGWSATNGTLSVVSGKLRVTNTVIYGRAFQNINLVTGQYRFSVEVAPGTAGGEVRLLGYPGEILLGRLYNSGTITFTATTASVRIVLIADTESAGKYCDFDNISLRRL